MRRKKKQETALDQLEDTIKREYKILKMFKEKNEDKLLLAAFLVVLTSLVVINTIYFIDHQSGKSNLIGSLISPPNPNRVLTSLQKAKNGAYETKVSNVTEMNKDDKAFTLAPTDTLLVMDISITNSSSNMQQLVPASQFYVRDREGGFYMMHPSSYLTSPLVLGTLAPGKTVTGQLSFAVPKILAHPLLYIDLGWEDTAPVVIDVMK